jgi:hypothetical protein
MRFSTPLSTLGFLVFLATLARSAGAAPPVETSSGGGLTGFSPTSSTETVSLAGGTWMASGSLLVSPAYGEAQRADNHDLGHAHAGFGTRFEGRYQWRALLFALGADYIQAAGRNPSRHLAFPFRLAVLPLRTRVVELGAGIGVGPAFSWYDSDDAADGSTLRTRGVMLEARIEGAIAFTDDLSLLLSTGARGYSEIFTNAAPRTYASSGFSWPATAVDVGVGIGWRL